MGQNVYLSEGVLVSEDGSEVTQTELVGESLVSGTVTLAGGDITAKNGHPRGAGYLYGGDANVIGGAATSADGVADGLYICSGEARLRSGDVTITSGSVDGAHITSNSVFVQPGMVDLLGTTGTPAWAASGGVTVGGAQARDANGHLATAAYVRMWGASVSAGGGPLVCVGGGSTIDGGVGGDVSVVAGQGAATGGTGGGVYIAAGQGRSDKSADGAVDIRSARAGSGVKVTNDASGATLLGFYGHTPHALQTGVAVSAAGIHAALVNLGLITA